MRSGASEIRGRRVQMEGMVNDLQLAREKQMQFDDWKKAGERELAIELSVNVLTTGFWPTYKAHPRRPPIQTLFWCRALASVSLLCLSTQIYDAHVSCRQDALPLLPCRSRGRMHYIVAVHATVCTGARV